MSKKLTYIIDVIFVIFVIIIMLVIQIYNRSHWTKLGTALG